MKNLIQEDPETVSQIAQITGDILEQISRSEESLKEISVLKVDNQVDDTVRKNVQYSLALKLWEKTQETRKIERNYLQKMKELNRGEDVDP